MGCALECFTSSNKVPETIADDLSAFKLESEVTTEKFDDEFDGGWEQTAEWDKSKDAVSHFRIQILKCELY